MTHALVRVRDIAGVFIGGIVDQNHDVVEIRNVGHYVDGEDIYNTDPFVRLGYEKLAIEGAKQKTRSNLISTQLIPKMTLIGVSQIIPCSKAAVESFRVYFGWDMFWEED